MTRYCYACKTDVELPDEKSKANVLFLASGHTDTPVKRLQRNFGRKQRPREWQGLPSLVTLEEAA